MTHESAKVDSNVLIGMKSVIIEFKERLRLFSALDLTRLVQTY